MDAFFKRLGDYNSRSLKFVRKLNTKFKDNYIKVKATMIDLEYGSSSYYNPTYFPEHDKGKYHPKCEYEDLISMIPMFNTFDYYKDMLIYIIEGRKIFRDKMELFNLEFTIVNLILQPNFYSLAIVFCFSKMVNMI